jgi:hypothetical protein
MSNAMKYHVVGWNHRGEGPESLTQSERELFHACSETMRPHLRQHNAVIVTRVTAAGRAVGPIVIMLDHVVAIEPFVPAAW